jgi:thiol-disulfide isomerase/thioredoxin
MVRTIQHGFGKGSTSTVNTNLLLLCLLTATSVAGGAQGSSTAGNATVVSESVSVYSQASVSSKVVGTLKKGDRVTVDFEVSGAGQAWCSLSRTPGSSGVGYVPCKALERAPRVLSDDGPLPEVITVGRPAESRPVQDTRSRQPRSAASGSYPSAPDFTLIELGGQKLRLADYRGKVVLLDFWATWCGPCRSEIPGFAQLQDKYRDQGFTVIGVSVDKDDPESVKEFYQKFKMNYPVALTDHKVEQLYGGVKSLPTTFLIGRDGRIYSRQPGALPASAFEDQIKTLLSAN